MRVRLHLRSRTGRRFVLAGRYAAGALALRYMPALGASIVRNAVRRHTARSASQAIGYSPAYLRSIRANLGRMRANRSFNGYVQPRVVFPPNPYRS